jgi:hypothetical protein
MVMGFSHNEEFDKWLHTQPKEICAAIAVRAELRVLPLFSNDLIVTPGKERDAMEQAIFSCFRASAIVLGAVKYSSDVGNLVSVVNSAIKELDDLAGASATFAVPDKIMSSATSAADCLIFDEYSDDAFEAVSLAIDAISPFKSLHVAPFGLDISFQSSTAADMTNVSSGVNAPTLLNFRLWNEETPQSILDSWNVLVSKLKKIDKNWDVWIRWYESVLAGGSTIGSKELCVFCIELSDEIWNSGPEAVLALIVAKEAEIKGQGANFSGSAPIKIGATGTFLAASPDVPEEIDGQSWDVDSRTGLLNPVFRRSNQTESEIIDMESLRPFLFECAQSLITAIATSTSNSVGQLLPAAERYLRSIENNSSLVSIAEVYAAGVRLRNSHDRIRREVENEGMPDVAINIGEAMDSVIGLHGPFILATSRGRELNARARDDNRTKAQELAYKAKSLEFSEALQKSSGLVTEDGKNLIVEINNEILTGPHPERSTMLAEASNHNFLVSTSKIAAKEYTKTVLVETVVGQAAIGSGIVVTNVALSWMIANAPLLSSLAATSPETLYWLPHFLRWLQAWYDTSRN